MSIPDYQAIMLPLLNLLRDKKEHSIKQAIDALAVEFKLTFEELHEQIPSGNQTVINNRVSWARTYLKKAGLLETTTRGVIRINENGIKLLAQKPEKINRKLLMQYPEFVEFQRISQKTKETDEISQELETLTPSEALEAHYQNIVTEIERDIIEQVKSCSPAFFEKLVVDLLVSMGYGGSLQDAAQVVGKRGDGGIDGIIKEDKLGLDIIYIQAKRWEGSVGCPTVQAFAGSIEGQRAKKGVLITTSNFTSDAKKYVTNIEKKIILIDGTQLAKLMIDYNVGVVTKNTYVIKKIDIGYFGEE